jgi:hypothetical protein
MISLYAVVRSFGFPAVVATTAQLLVAVLALGMVVLASRRLSPRQSLGITAIATLLISPYAYDYDLLILGIGLGFLLPDLTVFGTERERLALYALILFIGIFSAAQTAIAWESKPTIVVGEDIKLSLSGLALVAILVLTWRILRRSHERRAESIPVCVKWSAYAHATPPPAATSL